MAEIQHPSAWREPSIFPLGTNPVTISLGTSPASFPLGANPAFFPLDASPVAIPLGSIPAFFPLGDHSYPKKQAGLSLLVYCIC